MKAFNPETGKVDIDVKIPDKPPYQKWDIICKDCNNVIGGCVSGPNLPKPYISKYAICPLCETKNLELKLNDENN